MKPETANRTSPWHTSAAPQDGSPLVALGRVIYADGGETRHEPFCEAVAWQERAGYKGWHHHPDGLSVAINLADVVQIDFWAPYPVAAERTAATEQMAGECVAGE